MSAIGHVTKQKDGSYKGKYDLLRVAGPLDILPNKGKNAPNQPDFRLYSRSTEIGAAWIAKNQDEEEYVSLGFAHPMFGPNRIYANLGQAEGQDDPDVLAVIWNPKD